MGLDLWFSEDIRNALLAAKEGREAMMQTARMAAGVEADHRGVGTDNLDPISYLLGYEKGHQIALGTVALTFGLNPATIGLEERRSSEFDRLGLLEVGGMIVGEGEKDGDLRVFPDGLTI